MSKDSKTLEELIKALPPPRRGQVREYVESLLATDSGGSVAQLEFAWAGALKELGSRYTAVELQHEIGRWRTGGE